MSIFLAPFIMTKFHDKFIAESNRIEGITGRVRVAEAVEFTRVMERNEITVLDLEQFVSIYQPGARLRSTPGMNVQVGSYRPPAGGEQVVASLQTLLERGPYTSPFELHRAYENLHPFMDGNGRSGRMIWAWQMHRDGYDFSYGFLQMFYYQALQASATHGPGETPRRTGYHRKY